MFHSAGLFFLISGGLAALFAILVVWRMGLLKHTPRLPLYANPRSVFYVLWLFTDILRSSLRVSQLVWALHPPLNPALGWVKSKPKSDVAKSLLATSITLTPGTVCIDVKAQKMHIHVLEASSLDELKAGEMETNVLKTVM